VILVVTNSIQPAFTDISSFFSVTNQNITLAIGLVSGRKLLFWETARDVEGGREAVNG
jgi:hypothetical protein